MQELRKIYQKAETAWKRSGSGDASIESYLDFCKDSPTGKPCIDIYYLRHVDDLGEFADTIHVLQDEMSEGLPQSASVGKRPSSLDDSTQLQPAGSNVKTRKVSSKDFRFSAVSKQKENCAPGNRAGTGNDAVTSKMTELLHQTELEKQSTELAIQEGVLMNTMINILDKMEKHSPGSIARQKYEEMLQDTENEIADIRARRTQAYAAVETPKLVNHPRRDWLEWTGYQVRQLHDPNV
ncbi:hypothetical protein GUITHDRAFT_101129 [Guillardia theta CCMP2712]|uniref:Uncharacterized protein n=1 Tax=Guillardia theta (strain CCMP2712) TaxID=905079 RepID=L1JYI7_GUITC|nr:hypothetical protein GUITHDRAFT_101129 [Guillardia theta CCMP2712]EKX53427.1 hypothetical protein GUITHDRAFT_101129 [Guillardia theta CCMP2712]|eukprot:XP_005840407.1 hypothetical protein GUITHDRAFT_101129 [Guillardia theta CCMP2712]